MDTWIFSEKDGTSLKDPGKHMAVSTCILQNREPQCNKQINN